MRLHELVEDKIYIGEDGIEYKILDNHLCYLDGIGAIVATRLSILTQNFTPKKTKVKKTINLERWANYYSEIEIYYYPSKLQADNAARSTRLACIKLTGEAEIEVEE